VRCVAHAGSDGTRRRTGGEVKGKDANGVGSQSSWIQTPHFSTASSWLNWAPPPIEMDSPFRRKTNSGFCACAVTFRVGSTLFSERQRLSSEVCFRWILTSEDLILESFERTDWEFQAWGLLLEEDACVFGAVVLVFKLRVVTFRKEKCVFLRLWRKVTKCHLFTGPGSSFSK
jgi:hypothetical protein